MDPMPTLPTRSLLTLSDWRDVYRDGASPRQLLVALRERLLRESPSEAWITRTDAAGLAAQIGALETRLAAHPDRETAARATAFLRDLS